MAISSVLGSSALLPAGLGFRNVIINGGFDVWQRGTTAAIPSSVGTSYLADRWSSYRPAAGSTQSRVTAGLDGFQYALRIQRDSGNTGTGVIYMNQSFETSTMVKLANKQVTFSFYARAGANYSASGSLFGARVVAGTGTDINIIYTGVTGGSEPVSTNPVLTTSWQRFTATGIIPSGTTAGGVYFFFTPTGTAGANDYVDITGVQLEQNYQPTPFEQRPIGVETFLCQRYYWRQGGNAYEPYGLVAFFNNATNSYFHIKMPAKMRSAPTMNYSSLSHFNIFVNGTLPNPTAMTLWTSGSASGDAYMMGVNMASGGGSGMSGWLCNANTTSGFIEFSSEL